MCRFLLIRSKDPINPRKILNDFSESVKSVKSFDGDWQGDGWGIALIYNNKWKIHKSLNPIWKDSKFFNNLPFTKTFVVHARSASFNKDKNNILFNQPYIENGKVFAFNGLLKGVTLKHHLEGSIGAQKIWELINIYLKTQNTSNALNSLRNTLVANSKSIQALNIAIADGKYFFILNYFSVYPKYYQLYFSKNKDFTIVCSQPLTDYNLNFTQVDRVLQL